MVDVHRYRVAILYEYLAQERSLDLACFDIGVWHKESLWPLGGAEPAGPEALFFGGTILNEDETRSRDLGFDTAPKRLCTKGEYSGCVDHGGGRTVIVSQRSA